MESQDEYADKNVTVAEEEKEAEQINESEPKQFNDGQLDTPAVGDNNTQGIEKTDQKEENLYQDEAEQLWEEETENEEVVGEVRHGKIKEGIETAEKESKSEEPQTLLEQRQQFIVDIKKTQDDKDIKKVDSGILHLSHSSAGSVEGLSEAPEIITLETREFEEDGIAPDDEDMVPKKPKVQEEKLEEKIESVREDAEEEEDEDGAVVAADQEVAHEELGEEEEDEEEDMTDEAVVDLLYEIDEDYDPEMEYEDTREGDKDWVEPIYDSEDFISKPYLSDSCTISNNFLEFKYPFKVLILMLDLNKNLCWKFLSK